MLGKRRRGDDVEMEIDEDDSIVPMEVRGSKGKSARKMTPA